MKNLLPGLLLSAAATFSVPAAAQTADGIFPSGDKESRDSWAGPAQDAQADDDDEGRDGGSRQRPRSSRPNRDARGSAPAEAAARGAAVNAARSRGDAGFRTFAGEAAGNHGGALRNIEAKGDEALAARGRPISPAGQALANGRAPIAAGGIGPGDGRAFAEAAEARRAGTVARTARTARGIGGTAAGAAVGAVVILPTIIEITTGADIGIERYVFDGGKAIVTGDREAMATANRELGRRTVHVGDSIVATVQDPARIGRNVEQAGTDLAQTGTDVGAAVTEAVRDPARIGRDVAAAACSVGSFFTGGRC